MEITRHLTDSRQVLQISDYNAYRSQLTRQIHTLRRRLGLATHRREKFSKQTVSASDIARNREYAYLLLLEAERVWAFGMHIKTFHTERNTTNNCTGSARSHSISKFVKSAETARLLATLLSERDESNATTQDVLEAHAYHNILAGAVHLEKSAGSTTTKGDEAHRIKALESYSTAKVIYTALLQKEPAGKYRDLVTETIDPVLRYAAYQASLPRTLSVDAIAKRFFPREDSALASLLNDVNYDIDRPDPSTADAGEEKSETEQDIPSFVTWRGIKANVEDASIGQAIAAVRSAGLMLENILEQNPSYSTKERAGAYDGVLQAAQDATDVVKSAIEELEKSNTEEDDPRMRDLRVISLLLNHDLISWRVGRNRALIGSDDGMNPAGLNLRTSNKKATYKTKQIKGPRSAHLRDRLVLYDANIQSIQSVTELRGAARDSAFIKELEDQVSYFRALKCQNIAYSHALHGRHVQALALLWRARNLLSKINVESLPGKSNGPTKLALSSGSVEGLISIVQQSSLRAYALVELGRINGNSSSTFTANQLVEYPVQVKPVPVKPVLLDVAWNYIDYPDRQKLSDSPPSSKTESDSMQIDDEPDVKVPEKKRGWFGFGR